MCKSSKLTDSLDSLSIFIEKGAPDGHKISYKNSADEYINVRTGAVVVTVQEVPHPVFERKKNDLKIKIDITLQEALLGFTRTIEHLDGHTVTVDRTGVVTKPGLIVRMKQEGMPIFEQYGDYGDMLVTCIVNLPTELSKEQMSQFKEFFQGKE